MTVREGRGGNPLRHHHGSAAHDGEAPFRAHAVPCDPWQLPGSLQRRVDASGGPGHRGGREFDGVHGGVPLDADRDEGAQDRGRLRRPRVRHRRLQQRAECEARVQPCDAGAGGLGARAEGEHRQVRGGAAAGGALHARVAMDGDEGEGGVRRVQQVPSCVCGQHVR